ncbi:aldehyde dehydrogenase family protein [Nocardia rhamnosiphila]|uniref:aldehyde dehydrogenase family protein n=1 Tax=Nocardia rhamnosiphila TaxID=426716 RepID=UPI003F4CF8CA
MSCAGATKSEIVDPATGRASRTVELGGADVVDKAVASAQSAAETWASTPTPVRATILLAFRALLLEHTEELASIITAEQGKTLADARGEVARSVEAVEVATSAVQQLKGEFAEQVSRGVDTYSFRQPLGVCAGITPFNFPVMVPVSMFAAAIACGNSFVLKPSEKVPSASGALDTAADQGGTVVVDGRKYSTGSAGNFIGPSLVDHVRTDSDLYKEEIFGPVLSVVRVDDLEEALRVVTASPYGNGASIYTASGVAGRRFAHKVRAGSVGINVPIPVSISWFGFGGWGDSRFGDDGLNYDAYRFYTKAKVITQRWTEPRQGVAPHFVAAGSQ